MTNTDLDQPTIEKLRRITAWKALAKTAEQAAKHELEDITPTLEDGVIQLGKTIGRITISPATTQYTVTDPEQYATWLRNHDHGELTAQRTVTEPLPIALDPAFIATIAETGGHGTPDGVELKARDRTVRIYPNKNLLGHLAGGAAGAAGELPA